MRCSKAAMATDEAGGGGWGGGRVATHWSHVRDDKAYDIIGSHAPATVQVSARSQYPARSSGPVYRRDERLKCVCLDLREGHFATISRCRRSKSMRPQI